MENVTTIGFYYDDVSGHSLEIEYSARCLFLHPMINGRLVRLLFNPPENMVDITIEYGDQSRRSVDLYIPRQSMIFSVHDHQISRYSLPSELFANAYSGTAGKIYSVESSQQCFGPLFEGSALAFDAIEAVFFHLSRLEEFLATAEDLDFHGRMVSRAQFLVQHGLQRVPVVDHLSYEVLNVVGILSSPPKTSYLMSHDIDALRRFPSVRKTLRGILRTAFKERSFARLYRLVRQILARLSSGRDPYDTFDWMFDVAASKRRIVFFMSGGKTRYEGFYAIDEPNSLAAINFARRAGYTIGLHPSYVTSQEPDQLRHERETLERVSGQKVTDSRQHILRYSVADGPRSLGECAIMVDHTLGYQDLIGFRCGTGYRYTLFNLAERTEAQVQEQPLIVMDGPLLMEANYDISQARLVLHAFLTENATRTEISFNFHNSIFADLGPAPGSVKDLYTWLNEQISESTDSISVDRY